MTETGSTHRVRPVQAPAVGKYDSMVPKTIKKIRKHPATEVQEMVWGPSQEELDLKADLEKYTKRAKYGRGRLGQTMGINNTEYGVWQATIYMGGQSQVTSLVDTAAEITVVNKDKYNNASRVTSEQATLSADAVNIEDAGRKFIGQWATDDVCVSIGECATGQEFLYATSAGFAGVNADSVLGLARPN